MPVPTALERLLRERSRRLAEVPARLLRRVERVERDLLDRLLELLGTLERDGDKILFSGPNLERVVAIRRELEQLLTGGEYARAVAEFAGEFTGQQQLTDRAFRLAFPEITPSDLARQVLATSRRRAVDLLAGATVETNFLEPLADALTRAVISGADWTDTLRELRALVVGDAEYQAKLERHVKQVAWDSLAVADRTYAAAVARDLEAEWWYYSGGELPTTREFCAERRDRYWHTEEVRGWAALDWEGKMDPATTADTIFSLLGGWNCRHTLMPVSWRVVPEEDLARAEAAGYWQRPAA